MLNSPLPLTATLLLFNALVLGLPLDPFPFCKPLLLEIVDDDDENEDGDEDEDDDEEALED